MWNEYEKVLKKSMFIVFFVLILIEDNLIYNFKKKVNIKVYLIRICNDKNILEYIYMFING